MPPLGFGNNSCVFFYFSRETREFFCLDEPPGPFDSLEESRVGEGCDGGDQLIY